MAEVDRESDPKWSEVVVHSAATSTKGGIGIQYGPTLPRHEYGSATGGGKPSWGAMPTSTGYCNRA
jgi:hypothetical protein